MKKSLEDILMTEFSQPFVNGMRNRMVVAYHRYGSVADAYPAKIRALDSLELRLREYKATGNVEFLIDAANFAMIEFMHPAHPKAHFRSTDESESPGRVASSGAQTRQRNEEPGHKLQSQSVIPDPYDEVDSM